MAKPLVILRPAPPTIERSFTAKALNRLNAAYEMHVMPEALPADVGRPSGPLPRRSRPLGPPGRRAGGITATARVA